MDTSKPSTQASHQNVSHLVEQMGSVIDHVVDGIISIDRRGTITTFNRAAERIFGYAAEEVIGHNVRILMPEPYHHAHDSYIHNYLATGQAKIIGIGREVLGKRKDGSVFPMELAISEFQLGTEPHFTGIVRDITQRKRDEEARREAEERMRSVVDHVIDGIITIDTQARIMSFNPAAEKLFGYRQDEVIDCNVNMLMPEPYHREHDGYVANYLQTGRARIIGTGREVVGRRKDGSAFPMELAVSEFQLGKRRYFTGIVRDITERKRLEAELKERLSELDQADRQKNEFLAMLAHELRNPLAPMRNALQLLKMPGVEPEITQKAREIMDRQLEHLVRLVDDLLDVSRIVRGKVELQRRIVNLSDAVLRAAETAQPVIDMHGHVLDLRVPSEPVWVHADLVRLSQVIANLLTNAAKYTDRPGTVALTVARENDDAVVRVRDTGVGIAPAMLPLIFDLFVQGDRTLARTQGGLGIGLTLARRLVEMHGGTVSAVSEGIGKGSEFIVRLPVACATSEGSGSGPEGAATVLPAVRKRVLVVDDNVDACESVMMILQTLGYDVRGVHDGPSVLPAAQAFSPDAIVLDIGLPGMSGYEVTAQLRRQPEFRDTPIAAVTGYGKKEDRQRALDAGFDEHLVKPVDPDMLQAFLERQSVGEQSPS